MRTTLPPPAEPVSIEPLLSVIGVTRLLGITRRTLERERSAGRFPQPDLKIGKMPRWKPETIRRWIEGGGK